MPNKKKGEEMQPYSEAIAMLRGLKEALREQHEKRDLQVVQLDTMIGILNNLEAELENRAVASGKSSHGISLDVPRPAPDQNVLLEQFKNALARDNEAIRQRHEWEIKLFDSVLGSGAAALKTGMVINGGALVALMTFAGSMVAKVGALSAAVVSDIGLAATGFFGGVFLAGLGTAGTYFAQYCYMKHLEQEGMLASDPELQKRQKSLPRFDIRGDVVRLVTWGSGILSYGALMAGFWYAKKGVELVLAAPLAS